MSDNLVMLNTGYSRVQKIKTNVIQTVESTRKYSQAYKEKENTWTQGSRRPRVLMAARRMARGAFETSGLNKRTRAGSNKYMCSSTLPE